MVSPETGDFQAFKASIVRIYHINGSVVGAGFLVSDGGVLTCAHVITQALSLPQSTKEIPSGSVYLDFPLVAPGEKLQGQVSFWRPVSSTELVEDLAGLKLDSKLPSATRPVRLVEAEGLWKHPIRVFGFPKGHDNGIWASGVLRDKNAKGWLQMEDVKSSGYRVERGFSGTPVWNDELKGVVGIAIAAEKKRENVKAAFLVPAQVLREAWGKIPQPKTSLKPYQESLTPLEKGQKSSLNQEIYSLPIQPKELQELQQRIKKRITNVTLPDENLDPYSQLHEFLAQHKWRDADKETVKVILSLTKRKKYGSLRNKDIEKIPCLDLLKIDLLWLKASNNHFGFSVQQQLWLRKFQFKKLESKQFSNRENLRDFGNLLGWYQKDQLLKTRNDYTFSLDAPQGHLPSLRFPCSEFTQGGQANTNWEQSWRRIFSYFLIRTEKCLSDERID